MREVHRAREHGLEFTIKRADLTVPGICPAIGIAINWSDKDHCASLDRIDNSKGYVPENVQVISYKANAMKRNGTVEELERLVLFLKKKGC